MPLRGKALRDRIVLRLIAVDRALHFLVLVLLGVAVLLFAADRTSLRDDLLPDPHRIQGGVAGGPVQNSGHVGILHELDRLFSLRSGTLHEVGDRADRLRRCSRASRPSGLWFAKRWAEYLTFLATTILLPLEIYELIHQQLALKVIGFVINLAVVIYLLYAKRLFGLRGGARPRRPSAPATVGGDRARHPAGAAPARRERTAGSPARSTRPTAQPRSTAIGARRSRGGASPPPRATRSARSTRARWSSPPRDRELRAALFRFVDVVPACRSLDDLARHLIVFLHEVPETPPPLSAAMRMSGTRAGRAALGAAAAGGVRHLAHRFIVGEIAAAALGDLARAVGRGRGQLGRPARRGDGHPGGGRPLRRPLRARRSSSSPRPPARWPARPCSSATASGRCRGPTCRSRSRRSPRCCGPMPPSAGQRDAAQRLRPLLRHARDARRPPAHRHGVAGLPRGGARPGARAARRGRVPRRALGRASCSRPTCATRPSSSTRCSAGRGPAARDPPLTVRLVKGAYWDHELVQARQHGWQVPVFEDKADCDRNFETLTRRLLAARPALRVAIASHNLRSVAHAIAVNRVGGGAGRDLELQVLRGLGDELQDALAARGLRVRDLLPGRRPRGRDGLSRPAAAGEHLQRELPAAQAQGVRSSSCWPRPERSERCGARRSARPARPAWSPSRRAARRWLSRARHGEA